MPRFLTEQRYVMDLERPGLVAGFADAVSATRAAMALNEQHVTPDEFGWKLAGAHG